MNTPEVRAVFLDRDGTLNRAPATGQYIVSIEKMEMLPGASRLVRQIHQYGFLGIVVSNQQCVGSGLLSEKELYRITDRLHYQLAADGVALDGVYYCFHGEADGCSCRKPQSGMLQAAAKRFTIDLAKSYLIGDSWRDIAAGKAVGCTAIFLLDGERNRSHLQRCQPDFVIQSLPEAIPLIIPS